MSERTTGTWTESARVELDIAALRTDLDRALAACWRRRRRDHRRLIDELELLTRCQHAALLWPRSYQRLVDDRERALALWLFDLALAVAAVGLQADAPALLDALPDVDGPGEGRGTLLAELLELAACEAEATRPTPAQAADEVA